MKRAGPQLDTEKLIDTLENMRDSTWASAPRSASAAPSTRPRTRSGERRSTKRQVPADRARISRRRFLQTKCRDVPASFARKERSDARSLSGRGLGCPRTQTYPSHLSMRATFSTRRREARPAYASAGSTASSYSFLKRAISSAAGKTLSTLPTPWPRAPDLLPGLRLGALAGGIGAKTHLGGIGGRQVVRIQAGRDDRRLQIIAVHAGEEVGIDDVFAPTSDVIISL